MILYGKNSVFERLKSNPQSIRKIILRDNFDELSIDRLIKLHRVPCERLPSYKFNRIRHSLDSQGILAKVNDFSYVPLEDLLSQNKNLNIIFLDRIYDPQNLGAIIRTTACLGGFAIVIPKFQACEVNETVLHIASGGENYVPVAKVSNLSSALREIKKFGYWVVGGVIRGEAEDIRKVSFLFPLGLVLGSEGKGVRYGVEKCLDMKVYIPMEGVNITFNVSIACAIFCYEIIRQSRKNI
ncbi:MAG: 23S rRNA (guanosine(2251)-2'-O)-methyltransferase RlmB [Candidatus Omnitrophica bacterium]|nr:23S rRNA (guanosine(2251)-2'-O)-methyltransferase RlmB [Candidatus Omnitrophota bacterium]MCM8827171.1 23S rRNA (guanosine(2251)-2'-O)-methyltransferase RlmB [Candidatus Omnitrophota bacterium]